MRAFWIKQLHTWHWVSAALSLSGMLLFAVTGITLNHAALLAAHPSRHEQRATVPAELRPLLQALDDAAAPAAALAPPLARWVRQTFSADLQGVAVEVVGDDIDLSQSLPGGEASLHIDRISAQATYTRSSRGWVAYLNDLHKGRHAGAVWSAFIDALAAACIVFTLTGFALLWMHGRRRPFTWPLAGLSLLAPFLIALLFVHGRA